MHIRLVLKDNVIAPTTSFVTDMMDPKNWRYPFKDVFAQPAVGAISSVAERGTDHVLNLRGDADGVVAYLSQRFGDASWADKGHVNDHGRMIRVFEVECGSVAPAP